MKVRSHIRMLTVHFEKRNLSLICFHEMGVIAVEGKSCATSFGLVICALLQRMN